jgi:hypothetical protein
MFQAAAVRTRTTSPELAGAWINATCNIGIAGGAALGGLVLDGAGIRNVAWLAAALVVVSVLIAGLARGAFPARRERREDLPALGGRALVFREQPHHLLADLVRVRARAEQDLPCDALALGDQAQQDVLGPHVVVAEPPGLVLREHDNPPRAVSESLEHCRHRRISR